jgi:hypothetical protein
MAWVKLERLSCTDALEARLARWLLNVTRKRGIVDQPPRVPGRDALLPTVS